MHTVHVAMIHPNISASTWWKICLDKICYCSKIQHPNSLKNIKDFKFTLKLSREAYSAIEDLPKMPVISLFHNLLGNLGEMATLVLSLNAVSLLPCLAHQKSISFLSGLRWKHQKLPVEIRKGILNWIPLLTCTLPNEPVITPFFLSIF